MTRAEAKESARRKRRQADEEVVEGGRPLDGWGDLDQFSAHASRGVLRHMTKDDEAAGLSWDKFRAERGTAKMRASSAKSRPSVSRLDGPDS